MTSRQVKKELKPLLLSDDPADFIDGICRMRFKEAVNGLFSFLYDTDPGVRWHAVAAMGRLVSRAAKSEMESARVIMRRLMWNLNDESGGIGWGSPEAMGEIMAHHQGLAREFALILRSYIRKDENFIEHPDLQKGVLWAIGRLAGRFPQYLPEADVHVIPFLNSNDAVHRGYAAWASGNLTSFAAVGPLLELIEDQDEIELFEDLKVKVAKVGILARNALEKIKANQKE